MRSLLGRVEKIMRITTILFVAAATIASPVHAEVSLECEAALNTLSVSQDEGSGYIRELAQLRSATTGTPSSTTRSLAEILGREINKGVRVQEQQIEKMRAEGCIKDSTADSYLKELRETMDATQSLVRTFMN